MGKKVALLILDGLGIGPDSQSNAVLNAQTPHLDRYLRSYPSSKLVASGEAVGLPEGQMGNSEVGHMNLGAGRTVYQELGRIHHAVRDGVLNKHPLLAEAFLRVKQEGKKVHFIGLLSDGGVHSHLDHLKGLCDAAKFHHLNDEQVAIHAFLDGRDTDPHGGLGYLESLENHLQDSSGRVVSLIGRYFAMDRDHRWERIKQAYDLLVHGIGKPTTDLKNAIRASYHHGITDEFLKPVVRVNDNGEAMATIQEGDVVVCFNFRTDRGREITMALSQQDFPEYQMEALPIDYITMTAFDHSFANVGVLFHKENLAQTLGEVISQAGKTQTRIAETEKYPHVTFFFSGGREEPFPGENRLFIPSPKVPTYDSQPEMSAQLITEEIIRHIPMHQPDFICLNFANPDMVGHTGVYAAVIKAVETVDQCMKVVVDALLLHDYSILILADHGNAEYMVNEDGSPNTAHTSNLVPFIVIDPDIRQVADGKLGDVAPTILRMMALEIPKVMTGNILVQ
ncbi:MAG TPA: 2,3-bisphosphoglycerate-independent phosphoglycerate mutase [Sphingobacteriaceae bacterium]|nr:2,3-bisphosphoglycerate-independent phosphoglycerate mutase [Sphingobacteriaceae bacterium]